MSQMLPAGLPTLSQKTARVSPSISRAMALARLGRKDEARSIVQPMMESARESGLSDLLERTEQIMRAIDE